MMRKKKMNCPNCTKPVEPDQNFCRECGRQLSLRRPNRVRIGGVILLGLIFAGLLTAMGGKMFEMRWLAYLGLVVMMTSAFVVAAFAFLRETRPRKSSKQDAPSPEQTPTLDVRDTNKLLPAGGNGYVPSVVENTTELLKTPVKHRRES